MVMTRPVEAIPKAAGAARVGGYDSQYYGYLWSDVYASDMFDSVFAADPLSAGAGWRRWCTCRSCRWR